MAHEVIELNRRTRALTHLEIEIVFRAMIKAIKASGYFDLAVAANDWQVGLELIDAGLVDLSLQPYFNGIAGAQKLTALVEKARSYLPIGADLIDINELNHAIGSNINASNKVLERRMAEGGFNKVADLAGM